MRLKRLLGTIFFVFYANEQTIVNSFAQDLSPLITEYLAENNEPVRPTISSIADMCCNKKDGDVAGCIGNQCYTKCSNKPFKERVGCIFICKEDVNNECIQRKNKVIFDSPIQEEFVY